MNKILRRLGAVEKTFWLIDQVSPAHFVMAAEVDITKKKEEWREALKSLQNKHVILSAYITDGKTDPDFYVKRDTEIPIRFLELGEAISWESVVEQEMDKPFDWRKAPLVRVTVLNFKNRSMLIMAAHHAIADGFSMIFLMRDLFSCLTGKKLLSKSMPSTIDEILGIKREGWRKGDDVKYQALAERKNEAGTSVYSMALTPETSSQLIISAKQEQLTINALLSAALLLAGRKLAETWNTQEVNILIPVSSRGSLPVTDDCGMYITNTIVPFSPEQQDFWKLAQYIKDRTTGQNTLDKTKQFHEHVASLVFGDLDNQHISAILQSGIKWQLMVSNLGNVSTHFDLDGLIVSDLWGPISLSGSEGDQTVGISTIGGRIHMLHVSRIPLIGLLNQTERIIEDMLAVYSFK